LAVAGGPARTTIDRSPDVDADGWVAAGVYMAAGFYQNRRDLPDASFPGIAGYPAAVSGRHKTG